MRFALMWVSVAASCQYTRGLSTGENAPGDNTVLDDGSIAVDDVSGEAFVLDSDGQLYRADVDSKRAEPVADLSGAQSVHMLFPDAGPLILSDVDGKGHLELLDRDTWQPAKTATLAYPIDEALQSPGGRWIALVDTAYTAPPIHLLDSSDLSVYSLDVDSNDVELAWANQSDLLLAVVTRCVYGTGCDAPGDTGGQDTADTGAGDTSGSGMGGVDTGSVLTHRYVTRFLGWAIGDPGSTFGTDGSWPDPSIDIELPAVAADSSQPTAWIAVSPDDHWLVFPTSGHGNGDVLALVDLTDNSYRTVAGVYGPVGFTPDSSAVVGYSSGLYSDIVLVDVDSLDLSYEWVATTGDLSYFVTHEGNYVLVSEPGGSESSLQLIDLDAGTTTQVGTGVGLDEFVSRPDANELWLVQEPDLWRLDLDTANLEEQPVSFDATHINILPDSGTLVLDDSVPRHLYFVDADDPRNVKRVRIPSGCGCGTTGRGATGGLVPLALLVLVAERRRR